MNDTPTSAQVPAVEVLLPTTLDAMVGQYVKLRDTIKEADDAHKARTEPAKAYLEKLNGAMLEKLSELGLENAKTKFGTAYKTVKKTATIADGQVFRDYVIENQAYDLVDWRANATAVSVFLDANKGELPPGVNYGTFVQVGVRRA